jgi:hypothetical protein
LKDKNTASQQALQIFVNQDIHLNHSLVNPTDQEVQIMFNSSLNFSLSRGGDMQSFEYSEWKFSISHHSIKLIAVYRPPYSVAHHILPGNFFDEFSNYLEDIVLCPEILLIRLTQTR